MQGFIRFRIFLVMATILITSGFISPTGYYWQEGTVILESQESVSGYIFVDHRTHVVVVKQGDAIKAYPANKVMKFSYLDDLMEMNRNFIAYNMEIRKGVTRKVFLEIIFDGPIPLLRKEKKIPHSSTKKASSDHSFEHEHDYMYYAVVNNELIELCQFETRILPFIAKARGSEIDMFLQENKMKNHVLGHQIQIIDHYNFLTSPEYSKLDYDLALLD